MPALADCPSTKNEKNKHAFSLLLLLVWPCSSPVFPYVERS